MRRFFFLIAFFLISVSEAQVFDLVVASDGSGDYTTITRALAHRESFNSIFIKNGVYNEKLIFLNDGMRVVGESVDGVIIQNGDHANDGTHSTSSSYTLLLQGDNIYMENITVKNTAGNVGQAVAVRTTGSEITIKNCKFFGFQDTYYVDGGGTVYNKDCFIEGATDFIFGDATAVFDNCQINCLSGGQFITAPADPKASIQTGEKTIYLGLLMVDCDITADADVSDQSYYLGRPWKQNSSSVYVNCTLGSHIRNKGWDEWEDVNDPGKYLTAFAAEYQSVDENGAVVDVSGRADWSVQLTSDQVANYYNKETHLEPGTWILDPREAIVLPEIPQNLSFVASGTNNSPIIKWDEVEGVLGYAVLRDGKVEGFSESNSYQSYDVENVTEYSLKSVSANGALGEVSETIEVNPNDIVLASAREAQPKFTWKREGNTYWLSQNADVLVYSLNGQVVLKEKNVSEFNLATNLHGVFVVKCSFDTKSEIFKILL